MHRLTSPPWALAVLVLGSAAAGSVVRAETIYLRGGDVLKGTIVDRPDGKVEISTKHGARIVDRVDILRVEGGGGRRVAQPQPTESTRPTTASSRAASRSPTILTRS